MAQARCLTQIVRRSQTDRRHWIFKTLVLSAVYNQIEYQVRNRLPFMRFLGLELEDRVPDAKTVWFYRKALAGMVEALLKPFDGYLTRQGYIRAAVRFLTHPTFQ